MKSTSGHPEQVVRNKDMHTQLQENPSSCPLPSSDLVIHFPWNPKGLSAGRFLTAYTPRHRPQIMAAGGFIQLSPKHPWVQGNTHMHRRPSGSELSCGVGALCSLELGFSTVQSDGLGIRWATEMGAQKRQHFNPRERGQGITDTLYNVHLFGY